MEKLLENLLIFLKLRRDLRESPGSPLESISSQMQLCLLGLWLNPAGCCITAVTTATAADAQSLVPQH